MQLPRRDFLKNLAALTAGASAPTTVGAATEKYGQTPRELASGPGLDYNTIIGYVKVAKWLRLQKSWARAQRE
jgi:hypothetical protein